MQDFTFQYRLLVYLTNLTAVFFLRYKNKSSENGNKSSENDQSTTNFQSFFFFFSVSSTLNLKKNPANQLIKKSILTIKTVC